MAEDRDRSQACPGRGDVGAKVIRDAPLMISSHPPFDRPWNLAHGRTDDRVAPVNDEHPASTTQVSIGRHE